MLKFKRKYKNNTKFKININKHKELQKLENSAPECDFSDTKVKIFCLLKEAYDSFWRNDIHEYILNERKIAENHNYNMDKYRMLVQLYYKDHAKFLTSFIKLNFQKGWTYITFTYPSEFSAYKNTLPPKEFRYKLDDLYKSFKNSLEHTDGYKSWMAIYRPKEFKGSLKVWAEDVDYILDPIKPAG